MSLTELDQFIRKSAINIGFSKIGISPAKKTPYLEDKLSNWINNNFHATMYWINKRASERSNILNYYPDAVSVISIGMNYFTGNTSNNSNIGKISNYAWGSDYHTLIKTKLYQLLNNIKLINPKIDGIVCVDTSPIMEKYWAQKAGIGWIGKHTNLITRDYGSWLFLGEIILNTKLIYDNPFIEDLCGTCTACLDACPTNALIDAYILDSSKCISYLTIEHRGDFTKDIEQKLSNWIYGCDICQQVCPWNMKFEKITNQDYFKPRYNIQNRTLNEWMNLNEAEYKILFKGSAIKRTKYKGLIRNINHNLQSKN